MTQLASPRTAAAFGVLLDVVAAGNAVVIRYAVTTTPGGTVGNAATKGFQTFEDMTDTTSHELAEAVTDNPPFPP